MPPRDARESLVLSLVLSQDLVEAYAGLPEQLKAQGTAHELDASAPVPLSAHWRKTAGTNDVHVTPQLVVVWSAEMLMDRLQSRTLEKAALEAQAGGATALVVVNSEPGLEDAVGWLALEVGISVHAIKQQELATVLSSFGAALVKANCEQLAPSASKADFLQGLRAKDVLFNKAASASLKAAWLGALRQVLPEGAAKVVSENYKTYRSLYLHLRAGTEGEAERAIADLTVGKQRLGPAKARKLRRVMMATAEQQSDSF